jgi:hypothetical protein
VPAGGVVGVAEGVVVGVVCANAAAETKDTDRNAQIAARRGEKTKREDERIERSSRNDGMD